MSQQNHHTFYFLEKSVFSLEKRKNHDFLCILLQKILMMCHFAQQNGLAKMHFGIRQLLALRANVLLNIFAQQKCKQKSIFASNTFLHQAKIIHNCDKAPLVMDFAKQNVRHHGLCQLCCKNAFLHSHHGFCFLFYKNITFSEIKCDNSDL